jgi:CheY-like chemotaxis protein
MTTICGMNHTILMVEDNPDDVLFVRRQLRNSGLTNDLHVVSDGGEAINYLTGGGRYINRTLFPYPCLLLIDLRMPGIDGFSLTAWVRNNPETKDIPGIIYSASPSTEDAERAYALGADAYVAKLPGPRSFDLLFSAIRDFCPVP